MQFSNFCITRLIQPTQKAALLISDVLREERNKDMHPGSIGGIIRLFQKFNQQINCQGGAKPSPSFGLMNDY